MPRTTASPALLRAAEPITVADRPPVVTPGQHTLFRSAVLHLFPGLALATFVVFSAATVESWGLPALFALIIGIGLVIAPLELGYLVIHARRTTGSWSPLAAVDYRTIPPRGQLVRLSAGLAASCSPSSSRTCSSSIG